MAGGSFTDDREPITFTTTNCTTVVHVGGHSSTVYLVSVNSLRHRVDNYAHKSVKISCTLSLLLPRSDAQLQVSLKADVTRWKDTTKAAVNNSETDEFCSDAVASFRCVCVRVRVRARVGACLCELDEPTQTSRWHSHRGSAVTGASTLTAKTRRR